MGINRIAYDMIEDRNTGQKLNNKLDEVTSALAETMKYKVLQNELNVTEKSYPYGDIRRYGAVCDGVTDDSVAFNRAIAFAKTFKKPIYLPNAKIAVQGEFVIDFPVAIFGVRSNISHHNMGTEFNAYEYGTTIVDISSATSTGTLLTIKHDNVGGTELRDLTFYGQNTPLKSCLSFIRCGWDLRLTNISISDFAKNGIEFHRTYDTYINNLTIQFCGFKSDKQYYALYFDSVVNGGAADNSNAIHITNYHLEFCGAFIYANGARLLYFVNGKMERPWYHYQFNETSVNCISDVTKPAILLEGAVGEVVFSDSFFVPTTQALLIAYGYDITTDYTKVAYFIDCSGTTDLTAVGLGDYANIRFNNCDFASPYMDEGFKLIKNYNTGSAAKNLVTFNACTIHSLTLSDFAFILRNAMISNSRIYYSSKDTTSFAYSYQQGSGTHPAIITANANIGGLLEDGKISNCDFYCYNNNAATDKYPVTLAGTQNIVQGISVSTVFKAYFNAYSGVYSYYGNFDYRKGQATLTASGTIDCNATTNNKKAYVLALDGGTFTFTNMFIGEQIPVYAQNACTINGVSVVANSHRRLVRFDSGISVL